MDLNLLHTDSECLRNMSKSNFLELAYQESLQKSQMAVKDEGTRRLRLQILLLEDENDELHEQLEIADDHIDGLELERAELQNQLEHAEKQLRQREGELRIQGRELNNVKAELNSMNGLSVDSTKLLTDKLTLARELATLKPELDHLRTQAAYQQTILAEKLALQRQLSTLEVELETEKRALKRVVSKGKDGEKEAEFQKELDSLRKELAKEKKDKDKAQTAIENDSSIWQTRNASLESKIEQFKTRLREAKDHLRETQTELVQAQAIATKVTSVEVPTKVSRKRTAQQISTDAAIGTPDGVAVRGRRAGLMRGKPDQTLLGEKSMFSITPYLNKTISIATDGPQRGIETNGTECNDVDLQENDIPSTSVQAIVNKQLPQITYGGTKTLGPNTRVSRKVSKSSVLSDAKPGLMNCKAIPEKSRIIGSLEKVTEEDGEENVKSVGEDIELESKKPGLNMHAANIDELQPKKKRRKLLGAVKTLFDEDDGEATKRTAKVMLGQTKSLEKGSGIGLKPGLKVSGIGSFGTFSPLKKDKRGMQASFLI